MSTDVFKNLKVALSPINPYLSYGETTIVTPVITGISQPYTATWKWNYNNKPMGIHYNEPFTAWFEGWGDKTLRCSYTITKDGETISDSTAIYVTGRKEFDIYFPQQRTYGSNTGLFTVKDDPSYYFTCAVKGWLPPHSSAKYKYTLQKTDGTFISDLGTTSWVALNLGLDVGVYKIKAEIILTMPGYFDGKPQTYEAETFWYNRVRTDTTPKIDFDIAPLNGTNYLYNADKRRDFDINIRGANITVSTQASSEIWNDVTQAWGPRPAAVNIEPTPAKVRYQMYTPLDQNFLPEWGRMDYGKQYIYIIVEYTASTTSANEFVQIVKRVEGDFGKLLDGSWTYGITPDQTVPIGQYVSLSTTFDLPGYPRLSSNRLSEFSYWTDTNGDYVSHNRYLIAPTNTPGKFTYYTKATYFLEWFDPPGKPYARIEMPMQWTNLTVLENVQTATMTTKVVKEGKSTLTNPKNVVITHSAGYYDKMMVTPSDSKAVLTNTKWSVIARDGVTYPLGTGTEFYHANLASFLQSKMTASSGYMGELIASADLVEPGKITTHPSIRTKLYTKSVDGSEFLTRSYTDPNSLEYVRNVPLDADFFILDNYKDEGLDIKGPRYYDYLKPDLSPFLPSEIVEAPSPHITKLDTSTKGLHQFILSFLASSDTRIFAATRSSEYAVAGFGDVSLEITPPTTVKLNEGARVEMTLKAPNLPSGTALEYSFSVNGGEFIKQVSKTYILTSEMTATEQVYDIIGKVVISNFGYSTLELTAATKVEVKFIPEIFPEFDLKFLPPTKIKAPGDDGLVDTELTGINVSIPGLKIEYTWHPNDTMWTFSDTGAVFYWTDNYSAEGPKMIGLDVTLTAPGYESKKETFSYSYLISKARAPVSIVLNLEPMSINIKSGEVATIKAEIDGLDAFPGTVPDVITYAWYRNGILVPTETTDTYTVDSRIVSEPIPVYCIASVENTNFEPFTLKSKDCLVTITPPDGWPADFEVELTPNDVYAKLGDPDIVLSTVINMLDYDSLTYSWVKNGVVIPGETTATLTVKADTFVEQDHYQVRVVVKKAGLADLLAYDSSFIHVGVIKGYKPVIIPMNEIVYEGEKIIFGVLNENLPEEANVVYSWYLNSVQEMSGTNPFVRERLVGIPDNVQVPVYCSVYVELEGYESRTYQTEVATLSQRSGPTPGGVKIVPENGLFELNSVATLKAELTGVPTGRPVTYIWSVDGSAQQASDSTVFVLDTSSPGVKNISVTASLTTAGIPDGEFTSQTFATVYEASDKDDPIIVHPLPQRNSAFVWIPWWIVDEIQKGKKEGYDWKVDYAQLNYSGLLKSLGLALGRYPNLEMQESRHGYIFNKEQLELGYTAGSGLPFIYLK